MSHRYGSQPSSLGERPMNGNNGNAGDDRPADVWQATLFHMAAKALALPENAVSVRPSEIPDTPYGSGRIGT